MARALDPITFSVIWGGVVAAAAEIGTTMTRTAYSTAVREGSDFSTGMFDAEGNMVSQGDYSPGHLGSMAYTVKKMLDYYPIEDSPRAMRSSATTRRSARAICRMCSRSARFSTRVP